MDASPKVGLLAFIWVLAPWAFATETTNSETEVRTAVELFGDAFVNADFPVLKGLLDDNYMHINGGSGNVLNRDEWLKWVASRRAELESGILVVSDYRIEKLMVAIHGETAVVTGVAIALGTRDGMPYQSQMRFTNVWIHNGDAWRRAAFHDSPLPEKSH